MTPAGILFPVAFVLMATVTVAQQDLRVGGKPLQRLASATKSVALGLDVYTLEIFMPDHPATLDEARDIEVPKAVRLTVHLAPGSAPLPQAWREQLDRVLTEAELQAVRDAVNSPEGKNAWIIYTPGHGTAVSAGGRQFLFKPGADLMTAVINIALLHSGPSVELRNELLRAEPGSDGNRR